jgi:hypothetical protein
LGIWYTWRGSFVRMGSGDEEFLKVIEIILIKALEFRRMRPMGWVGLKISEVLTSCVKFKKTIC